jgi:hydrogenase maturation protein HypF
VTHPTGQVTQIDPAPDPAPVAAPGPAPVAAPALAPASAPALAPASAPALASARRPAREDRREDRRSLEIRVRGLVQGVGFRPMVWRLARELGVVGQVWNDGQGVAIVAAGSDAALAALLTRLRREPPPLARVDSVETAPYGGELGPDFHIVASEHTEVRTQIAPDAAMCRACAAEVVDPFADRFRYPFTTCTHCGPRLSIVQGIPYDRATTTMAGFTLCPRCAEQYGDPADRRFHAETTACHRCGPRARLVRLDGAASHFEQHSMLDDVDAVYGLLTKGEIVAIKGLGGYHLACDATSEPALAALRARKHRDAKPFALMARDLDVIRQFCAVSREEEQALTSAAAPIVLLAATGPRRLPDAVAPGLATLGFMLPTTPLHFLILRRLDRPVVMTSGNLSDEPQATDDDDARARLAPIAAYALLHDRGIANRVDDSVARVMDGRLRLLRRARGYAPTPLPLPPGFAAAPQLLAMGAELKATFCLLKDGQAILSQHQGDLGDAATLADYQKHLALFGQLFRHQPQAVAIDRHPEMHSATLGRAIAAGAALPVHEIQHHHAHVAAVLVEHRWPLAAPPVTAVVLDGLGYGDHGELWGGEILRADYHGYIRRGMLRPAAMIGGEAAAREPWRNLYAHLMAEIRWPELALNFGHLDVVGRLAAKPRALLDSMLKSGQQVPLASSCGRLFDAVAAALGLCFERQAYEGHAATLLESLAATAAATAADDDESYPVTIPRWPASKLPYLEPRAMWNALLGDLHLGTPRPVIAARFHRWLARGVTRLAEQASPTAAGEPARTVVLAGGCFQNRVLLEETSRCLRGAGFTVLSAAAVPANDGGIALGQAAIAAAHMLAPRRSLPCV